MGRSGTQRALSVQGDGRIVGTDTHTHRDTHTDTHKARRARAGKQRREKGKGRKGRRKRELAAAGHWPPPIQGAGQGNKAQRLGLAGMGGAGGPPVCVSRTPRPAHSRPRDPLSGLHSPAVQPGSARASRQSRAAPRPGMVQRPLVSAATPAPRPPEPLFQGRPVRPATPPAQGWGTAGRGLGDPREGDGPPPRPAQVAEGTARPAGPARRRRESLVGALQCNAVGGLGLATAKPSSFSLSFPPQGVPRRLWVALGTPAQERCPTSSSRPLGSLEINPARAQELRVKAVASTKS